MNTTYQRRGQPAPQNNRRAQRGILLLEVLISVLIFSIALLGLVALQARAVQFSVSAEDRNRAALLVNNLVATMWMQDTVNTGTLSGEITAWQAQVRSALPPFDNTVGATVQNGTENGVETATITVTWVPTGANGTQSSYTTQVMIP